MRNAFCSQEGPIRELSCIESFLVLNRLSRLLHKQKFDEALRFAKQFNLDIEVRFYIKDGNVFVVVCIKGRTNHISLKKSVILFVCFLSLCTKLRLTGFLTKCHHGIMKMIMGKKAILWRDFLSQNLRIASLK